MNKQYKNKMMIIVLSMVCFIIMASFFFYNKKIDNKDDIAHIQQAINNRKKVDKQAKKTYEECLSSPFKYDTLKNDLTNLYKKISYPGLSIYFEDLKNDWQFNYNTNVTYYGASLIKLLMASYLVSNAVNKNDNLDKTLPYSLKYQLPYSLALDKHKLNDNIAIKDLISYILKVSDNGAYDMLYDYVGYENLKAYADYLKINVTINEIEHFGNLTISDATKIIKQAYQLIQTYPTYRSLFLDNMDNDYYNYLNFKDVKVYHKFGEYIEYYHDMGLKMGEYPYIIVIMSNLTSSEETKEKFQNIHQELYKIYEKNIALKEAKCKEQKKLVV